MLLTLIKVEGHSMEPNLKEGSFFMASSIPFIFVEPKINDIVIFKSSNKLIVKKICKIKKNKYFVEGMNSKDSKYFDPIEKTDIIGKLIFKL